MADLVYGLLGLFINSGVPQDLACISANTQEGTQSPIWELLKYHCVSLSAKLQLPPAELGEVVLTPCRQGLAFFWYLLGFFLFREWEEETALSQWRVIYHSCGPMTDLPLWMAWMASLRGCSSAVPVLLLQKQSLWAVMGRWSHFNN